jgi:asparaginyl-tRNA synthetase
MRTEPWHAVGRYLRILDDPWYRMVVDLQDVVSTSTFSFFHSRGLKAVHLPLTTHCASSPAAIGSDSSPVSIQQFGIDTYLADSMQFALEYACRLSTNGAYYIMPSFRGDEPDAAHLCQFYHSEAEIPGTLEDVLDLAEEYVRHVASEVLLHCRSEMEYFAGDLSHVEAAVASPRRWRRMDFDAAVQLLPIDQVATRQVGGRTFRLLHKCAEKLLAQTVGEPIWLLNPDRLSVPFYQAFTDDTQTRARAADLIAGIGEMIGAGERHATAVDAELALSLHGVEREPYDWYLELRRQCPMRTAGFGMGVERLLCWLLNHDDVRDLQLLPRRNGARTVP